ncbi:hypothetical protein ACETRX_28125 [Labrys portucalensis]|uniref:Uncharacterized protein n=2 Tax=Xanthobacteraceae TaxID=335928 RepID=A0A974PV72_9HYPH|nr:hypothetical protein [Xanthobacter dioxanivorans]QRG09994.1 hypothetical protein EZH22_29405 [Xanthobacter dioxanivorans]
MLWPDGTWATLEAVRNGDFGWMSDGFEIIDHMDDVRPKAAGVIDETM